MYVSFFLDTASTQPRNCAEEVGKSSECWHYVQIKDATAFEITEAGTRRAVVGRFFIAIQSQMELEYICWAVGVSSTLLGNIYSPLQSG